MLTLSERDGSFSVYHVELPGEWLHAFLFDWEDGPGEGQQALSVEAVSLTPGPPSANRVRQPDVMEDWGRMRVRS